MAQHVIRYRREAPVPASGAATVWSALPVPPDPHGLLARFEAIRVELEVRADFSQEVTREALDVSTSVDLPDRDETGVPFCTIDPPGSMDLDQALHIERAGDGYRVRYAIADVPAFVVPGGAIDAEARRRAVTIYAPDRRSPLHPPQLSEGAASLLPEQVRPAFVWDLVLDADGNVGEGSIDLYRARVRSVDRLDYDHVQREVDAGTDDERLSLLKEVGEKRIALERQRGGASLPMPEQEVKQEGGDFVVSFRPPLAAEDWNAQISLMTGMAAATLMLRGGVGILRTMPPPDDAAVARFRRQSKALGVQWPMGEPYGEFLRRLDRDDPRQLALIHEATALFRGAGYTPFDGATPDQPLHGAVAAPYAHVTAPLRRLVDRFGLVVCAALAAKEPVPAWVREALPGLPDLMRSGDHKAHAVDRACTDAVEAAVLVAHVGETFGASVVDADRKGQVVVQLTAPAIVDQATGSAELGAQVRVRVDAAEVATSRVDLVLV